MIKLQNGGGNETLLKVNEKSLRNCGKLNFIKRKL